MQFIKKWLHKIKEHWLLSTSIGILICLIAFATYYFVNGGTSGISRERADKELTTQEWKMNKSVNKYQQKEDYIAPVPIVKQAVADKFGSNFDYAGNFKQINAFIQKKFNQNTAIVMANNTGLVAGMSTKEQNSAIGNIKLLTTSMYGGITSKEIDTNLQTGTYTAKNTLINIQNGNQVYSQNKPIFFKDDDGKLIGLPTIITTKSDEADNEYPYNQMLVYISPQEDITINQLLSIGKELNVSVNGTKVHPTFTDLINHQDKYDDNNTLNATYKQIKDNHDLGLLNTFSVQNSNGKEITLGNANKNLHKKLIGQDFYVLSYEVPNNLISNNSSQTVNVQINGGSYTLTNMSGKQNINFGDYQVK